MIPWEYLGLVEYDQSLLLQSRVRQEIAAGRHAGRLLLLEHPSVITLGRHGKPSNILDRRFPVVRTDRGGDATYHGPGQLVGYPVIKLADFGLGVRRYADKITEIIIKFMDNYGVEARIDPVYPGVWTSRGKIAAIGINAQGGITTHGFAININVDLSAFDAIVPCGISDRPVTSLANFVEKPPELEVAAEQVAAQFNKVIG